MNSHDSQPKLPMWIFIVTDVALIGVAALIGFTSHRPFSSEAMLWMTMCVIVGAAVGLVPVIAWYERQKNETLDDRQRALEALARTVHSSAEQISIAAGGLHEIAELAQKNLRLAEHLPQKLQEKIAEFQAQLSTAEDAQKEELERELLALRTTESERLESVSQRIAKSSAEWTKLEAATQQHLAAATEALNKLSLGTASAIGKAQAAAEQALAQARTEAARTLGDASGKTTREIEAAKTAALAEIDAKFAAAASAAAERALQEIAAKFATAAHAWEQKIARLEAAAASTGRVAPATTASAEANAAPVAPTIEPAPAPAAETATETASEPAAVPPPKKSRKPRRDDVASPPPAPEAQPVVAAAEPTPTPPAAEPTEVPAVEPPPVPVEKIVEIAPVAPHTTEPFAGDIIKNDTPSATEPLAAPAAEPTASPAAAPRKRAKKTEPVPSPADSEIKEEPSLGLDLDGVGNASEPAVVERVLTSDGATRLLVTAYIGIGNRLFIRGAGPGLSWEKGVPLQFVSIGKWRWETNDASAPVQFKLYKNDEIECAALGAQTLAPGHQDEVTAAF